MTDFSADIEIVKKDFKATEYFEDILYGLAHITKEPPISAVDLGNQGEVRMDDDYIYICIATDTWKRIALTTW